MANTGTQVVHKPARNHQCNIGWKPAPLPAGHVARTAGFESHWVMDGAYDPPGTIRQCGECGKTWVGYRTKAPAHGMHTLTTQWRPEGLLERWRRQRRAAREARQA